jgi:hypothetical protein
MKKSLTAKSFLLIVFLFIYISNNSISILAQPPTIQSVDIEQLNLRNMTPEIMYSQYALLTLGYMPAAVGYYLTIGIERPSNFTFDLVVQNMYLPAAVYIATLQYLSMRISLAQLGITNGTQLPPGGLLRIYIHMATSPILNPTQQNFYHEYNPTPTYGDDDLQGIVSQVPVSEPQITLNPPSEDYTPVNNLNYRGCRVPNVDLDDSLFPDGESYAGDKNACGPASAANSMAWLADVYSTSIQLNESLRDILTELSNYMKRARNEGVTIEQFVQGKLDFIKAKNLPINVKFQSASVGGNIHSSDGSTFAHNENGGSSYPTWGWLKAEIDSGEDVEAMYYWWDGEKWKGHAVVITDYEETTGGKKTIKYKHDRKQGVSGGTQQEPANIYIDPYGRMIIYNNGVPKTIRNVVAESPGDPFTPVELSSFSARINGDAIELEWITATEVNNSGFEIEKSIDRKSFYSIGFVQGKGTTTDPQSYYYLDKNIGDNLNYYYRLKQIDFDGKYEYSKIVEVENSVPKEFRLRQNYPNPFNPVTSISYELPIPSQVIITVYDITGKEIKVLVNENKPAGKYQVDFDASDVPSGVYFYKLQTENYSEVRKMNIIK